MMRVPRSLPEHAFRLDLGPGHDSQADEEDPSEMATIAHTDPRCIDGDVPGEDCSCPAVGLGPRPDGCRHGEDPTGRERECGCPDQQELEQWEAARQKAQDWLDEAEALNDVDVCGDPQCPGGCVSRL